jgi:hypothetical protein
MNWESWLLSGFVATLALSTLLAGSQALGLTRMNLPYLIGTIVTSNREKARLYGTGHSHFERMGVLDFVYPAV